MRPPALSRFEEFDAPPAFLLLSPSEDVNCDSTRELRRAMARFSPGSPRTHSHSDKELPQGRSIANYAAIARPGFLPAGRCSRQQEKSTETCCGNEPVRAFRAEEPNAIARRSPRPKAFARRSLLCSRFRLRRLRHC